MRLCAYAPYALSHVEHSSPSSGSPLSQEEGKLSNALSKALSGSVVYELVARLFLLIGI